MEMKEIALKFCNLPEGEYESKNKLGNIKIQNIRLNERNDFRIVKIFINNELYDEITYSTFDYFHLWEKVHKKNDEQEYILKREMLENKTEIKYCNENDEVFYINNNGINSYNDSTLAGPSYCLNNGIFSKNNSKTNSIAFIYNVETNEKKLHIKTNDKKEPITINGDIYRFIIKYNKLINKINKNTVHCIKNEEELNEFTNNGLEELINTNLIPIIDINNVKKLDKELDKYLEIYKEYLPKLNESHSHEILETLNMVATTLDTLINIKQENEEKKKTTNKPKIFNLSKYKNK